MYYVAALAQMKHVSTRSVDGLLKRELRVEVSGSQVRD
jgi:transposase-like protein